jgi:hypothetical protein
MTSQHHAGVYPGLVLTLAEAPGTGQHHAGVYPGLVLTLAGMGSGGPITKVGI